MTDLTKYLKTFRQRLRLRDGWRMAQRTLWLAALAGLLVQLAGRLWPIERLWVWSVLPLAVWLLASFGYALFQPMSLMRAATRVDGELGLRERLSTALAFQPLLASVHAAPTRGPEAEFHRLTWRQRQDALDTAAGIRPAQAFPMTWQPRPLAAAALLAAAVLAAAWLPNPMDAVLAEREAVRQEAARQAERVEELEQQIEQAQELTPEQRDELLRQLRELAEKLRQNDGSLEQAMADLSNLEKSLQERLDPNALAQQANMEALAEQLSRLAQQARDPNQSAADAAAQALAELAAQVGEMTPEERQQAAEQLAQMAAQTAQTGDDKLAESLSAMAQAMAQANSADAAQAAQASALAQAAAAQARGDLKQAEAQLSDQQALQQALQQLQNSRQQLAQAAQAAQQATQPGQPGQSGQPGQANQPGQQPGSQPGSQPGQGPGQGPVAGGGGSNSNTLPPSQGGQTNVRPQGNAANPAAGELPGQVYAPWQRPNTSGGEQVFIPGQDTGQGETSTSQGQSNLPGSSNPALVPYSQVYGTYYNSAIQSLQQSYVPTALQDYVKNYFSQLAP